MGPRHECLPFGGPHRHGIHYITSTVRKTADCAKIPQEQKKARVNLTVRHDGAGREKRGTAKSSKRMGTPCQVD